MRNFLQTLSPRTEFVIVVAGAFGLFIVTSLFMAVHPIAVPQHSESGLWQLAIHEIIVLGLLGSFLIARGWTLTRIGLMPTLIDTAIGLGLALAAYLAYAFAWSVLVAVSLPLAQAAANVKVMPTQLSLVTVAAVCVVNPLYEELFVAGYVVTALKEGRGATFALNCSVAIRLLYHLYQGVAGILSIIPLGLIFGYWYVRTGKLWPLIVAHAAIDLFGMLAYVKF